MVMMIAIKMILLPVVHRPRAGKGEESGICLSSSTVKWWQCSQSTGICDPEMWVVWIEMCC